jgi:hypothetical protein
MLGRENIFEFTLEDENGLMDTTVPSNPLVTPQPGSHIHSGLPDPAPFNSDYQYDAYELFPELREMLTPGVRLDEYSTESSERLFPDFPHFQSTSAEGKQEYAQEEKKHSGGLTIQPVEDQIISQGTRKKAGDYRYFTKMGKPLLACERSLIGEPAITLEAFLKREYACLNSQRILSRQEKRGIEYDEKSEKQYFNGQEVIWLSRKTLKQGASNKQKNDSHHEEKNQGKRMREEAHSVLSESSDSINSQRKVQNQYVAPFYQTAYQGNRSPTMFAQTQSQTKRIKVEETPLGPQLGRTSHSS